MAPPDQEGPGAAEPAASIWIDAQLPPAMVRWFRADLGVESVHVEDLGLLKAKDGVIFQAARAAGPAVVVVTKDDDFRRLVLQHGPPPHVVWVRCGNVTNREMRGILLVAWPRVAALLSSGEPLVELRRRGRSQPTGA